MRNRFVFLVALASAALLAAGGASAASITYFLSQSNDPEGWLPDSTQDYLTVTLADGAAGNIDVTVEIQSPLTSIADANFGIQSFMFNSSNILLESEIIGLPVHWNVSLDYDGVAPHQRGNGFGIFEIGVTRDPGGARQSPSLSFSISKDGDSLADYAVLSTDSIQGNTFFAVHVAGFVDQDPDAPLDPIDIGNPGIGQCYDTTGQGDYTAGCNILTSAWFGGNSLTPIPEPSTGLLLGLGLVGLAGLRRRR